MATSRSLHNKMLLTGCLLHGTALNLKQLLSHLNAVALLHPLTVGDDTKMFRRVPRVIIESEDESEVGDDDSDGMVTGDDFEGFDADDDLFEII